MTDTTTPAPAEDQERPELPPFTGITAVCVKCGYNLVSTEYQPPVTGLTMLKLNGTLIRGPLPERQRRECERCRYQWHEAVGSEPELLDLLTERELAHALDNATPYPVELHPQVAAAMAANLVKMVDAYARPEHVVWGPHVQDAHPAPAETPPTEEPAEEEPVAGLEEYEPERAAVLRVIHAAARELEDVHAHHLVPGVAPQTGTTALRVLRSTARRLRRGEETEDVLLSTVDALARVLAGGEPLAHIATGVDS